MSGGLAVAGSHFQLPQDSVREARGCWGISGDALGLGKENGFNLHERARAREGVECPRHVIPIELTGMRLDILF